MRAAAYINIQALQHNFAQVKQHCPRQKVMAMVKANAYGHGVLEVTRALKHADAFGVATVEEARQLRDAGVKQTLFVMGGFVTLDALQWLQKNNVVPLIHSDYQIDLVARLAQPLEQVVFKIDSGMHRLGFKSDQMRLQYQRLMALNKIKQVPLLMTHFSDADNFNNKKTAQQLQCFKSLTADLTGKKSFANSAAILRGLGRCADWVRPGIMLYGISPYADKTARELNLKPVMQLAARVVSIKRVERHAEVGYGSSWRAEDACDIAILSLGYGDGIPRDLPAATRFFTADNKLAGELVGRVSMDFLTVKLQADIDIGEMLYLWGDCQPVEIIAKRANLFSYQLVTQILPRVARVGVNYTLVSASVL